MVDDQQPDEAREMAAKVEWLTKKAKGLTRTLKKRDRQLAECKDAHGRIAELKEQLKSAQQDLEESEREKRNALEEVQKYKYKLEAVECRLQLLEHKGPVPTFESVSEQIQALKLQHDKVVNKAGQLSVQLAFSQSVNDELSDRLLAVNSNNQKQLASTSVLVLPMPSGSKHSSASTDETSTAMSNNSSIHSSDEREASERIEL